MRINRFQLQIRVLATRGANVSHIILYLNHLFATVYESVLDGGHISSPI